MTTPTPSSQPAITRDLFVSGLPFADRLFLEQRRQAHFKRTGEWLTLAQVLSGLIDQVAVGAAPAAARSA